jgi:hypothetical protein
MIAPPCLYFNLEMDICIKMFSKEQSEVVKPQLVTELKLSFSDQFIWHSTIVTGPNYFKAKEWKTI